jgi:hypothetical protein
VANLTDEILMAYADGELGTEDRARVDAVLERDPNSRARLAIFQSTGTPLAALYQKPMLEAPPAHLVNMVLNHGSAKLLQTIKRAARPKSGLAAWRLWVFPIHVPWPMAFASVALLVAGGGLGWFLRSASEPGSSLVAFDKGHLFATGALQQVLEKAPSLQEARIDGAAGNAVTARVILTFKSKAQTYCREYEVGTSGQGSHTGLGCRDKTGKWAIQVYVPSNGIGRPGLAGGAGTPAIDTIVDEIMDRDALGRNDETAAIKAGWR